MERLIMLIDETDDELLDRIESLIYVLGERMELDTLRENLEDVVDRAMADVEVEQSA